MYNSPKLYICITSSPADPTLSLHLLLNWETLPNNFCDIHHRYNISYDFLMIFEQFKHCM